MIDCQETFTVRFYGPLQKSLEEKQGFIETYLSQYKNVQLLEDSEADHVLPPECSPDVVVKIHGVSPKDEVFPDDRYGEYFVQFELWQPTNDRGTQGQGEMDFSVSDPGSQYFGRSIFVGSHYGHGHRGWTTRLALELELGKAGLIRNILSDPREDAVFRNVQRAASILG